MDRWRHGMIEPRPYRWRLQQLKEPQTIDSNMAGNRHRMAGPVIKGEKNDRDLLLDHTATSINQRVGPMLPAPAALA
ncbi:MAG: hypothetical protein IT230_03105 [Flavobacteriales bacterium]|nr:hypothetical protein [Flavobacteriales bacterium]